MVEVRNLTGKQSGNTYKYRRQKVRKKNEEFTVGLRNLTGNRSGNTSKKTERTEKNEEFQVKVRKPDRQKEQKKRRV